MDHPSFENYLNRAYEYDEQDQPEKALQALDQALALDDTSAETHNFRGILLEKFGKKEEAVSAYETAVRLDPDYVDAVDNLAGLKGELENEQRKNTRFRHALIGAGIGAYAFGISFLIYGLLSGWFRSSNISAPELLLTALPGAFVIDSSEGFAKDLFDYLLLLLRMLACGIGLAFINRDVYQKSFRNGFLVGFFSFGLGELFFLFYSPADILWYPYSLVGIFVGLLFGLSQKEPALLLPFAFAGGLGFGLEPALRDLSITLVLDNSFGNEQITIILISLLIGILGGSVKGVCLGIVAGWFSKGKQSPAIITPE